MYVCMTTGDERWDSFLLERVLWSTGDGVMLIGNPLHLEAYWLKRIAHVQQQVYSFVLVGFAFSIGNLNMAEFVQNFFTRANVILLLS